MWDDSPWRRSFACRLGSRRLSVGRSGLRVSAAVTDCDAPGALTSGALAYGDCAAPPSSLSSGSVLSHALTRVTSFWVRSAGRVMVMTTSLRSLKVYVSAAGGV